MDLGPHRTDDLDQAAFRSRNDEIALDLGQLNLLGTVLRNVHL